MRVVSAADVTRLLPVADAIPLMIRAFRLFSAGTGAYPLRTHLSLHDPSGDALVMPAYDGTAGLGVKLVTVHPHNPDHGYPAVRAHYLLVRAGDGEPLMVCDGAALTALRTGAASGAHINAVGAYRADMRELDPHVIARARIYVDSREAALAEAGDLVMPLRAGTIDEAHVRGELGEILLSRVPGRESAEDITVFKSV